GPPAEVLIELGPRELLPLRVPPRSARGRNDHGDLHGSNVAQASRRCVSSGASEASTRLALHPIPEIPWRSPREVCSAPLRPGPSPSPFLPPALRPAGTDSPIRAQHARRP